MRKIPTTMATQHPDNASAPYWQPNGDPFVNTQRELKDCYSSYHDLGVTEYMWDWEGKYADAAVVDKLFTTQHEYFKTNQLGRDKFLTFRIPNVWEEKGYSLMQAMSVILSAEDFAHDLGFEQRPLFEVILPMTENADQLMHMHHLFEELSRFKNTTFKGTDQDNRDYIELIPLVESVTSQQHIGDLLDKYMWLYREKYNRKPEYIRPFLARSDPALVSGLLATALANKVAVSQLYKFSARHEVPVYPIAGVGSLPFRGGVTPDSVADYVRDNPGVRTVSLQSSFRFDHPVQQVKAAIKYLDEELPKTQPRIIDEATEQRLEPIIRKAEDQYQQTLKGIAADMQPFFGAVPKRRERRQHIGLLSYQRSMGEQPLPRAITFTAGFYSVGMPPEFIGVGSAFASLSDEERALVLDIYPSLVDDVTKAGRYLNRENLHKLARRNQAWRDIEKDVAALEKYLGIKFAPRTLAEKSHANITANVLLMKQNPEALTKLIGEAGLLRRSLG